MEVIAYNSGLLALTDGSVAFASDDVYCVLLTSSYTPDPGHETYSDLTNEVTDEDYEPADVGGKSVTLDDDTVVYDSDDISFGEEVSISGVRYAVFVVGDEASPQAADPLLWYVDFGQDVSSTDAAFILRTTNGLYQIGPAA